MNESTTDHPRAGVVPASWLREHLHEVDVLEVADDEGLAGFRAGHLPGAVGVEWKRLCWHDSDREFATAQELADRLGEHGIDGRCPVVLYGDPVQYGTYAYWTFALRGLGGVRLLDGGKEAWQAGGHPFEHGRPAFEATTYRREPGDPPAIRVERDELRSSLGDPDLCLLDVRSAEEYAGERVSPPDFALDHGAERGGRIPGARHLYYRDLLRDDGTFLTREAILDSLSAVGWREGMPIVTYCRLSHRATLVWTALTRVAGLPDVRVYDGSWTEWGTMVGMPVER